MRRRSFLLALLLISTSYKADWGFYAHKKINYLAVFTLPPELIGFYKKNIDFITEHAVDADKRRYASPFEAIRHYIDLDHWGKPPFENLPRNWMDFLMENSRIFIVNAKNDTAQIIDNQLFKNNADTFLVSNSAISKPDFRRFFSKNIEPQYFEEQWVVSCDSLKKLLNQPDLPCLSAFAVDSFTKHGILPYHLRQMQFRLTKAFEEKDFDKILRLSADIGHYIGDAHVPLHTTKNYNGQLTDQLGIHAFWETRLPELFADTEYDFWVGQANYIEQPQDFYWDIVFKSHSLVGEVLSYEKELSRTFPSDQQYCIVDRLGSVTQLPCPEYARAYQDKMQGMVEQRMRDAILALGSAWYTAWVNAGSPNLEEVGPNAVPIEDVELEKRFQSGKFFGREHSN